MQGKFTRSNLKELKLKIIALTHVAMSVSEDDKLADIFRTAGASLCAGIDLINDHLEDGDSLNYIILKED